MMPLVRGIACLLPSLSGCYLQILRQLTARFVYRLDFWQDTRDYGTYADVFGMPHLTSIDRSFDDVLQLEPEPL